MSYEPTLIISRDDLRLHDEDVDRAITRLQKIKKPSDKITAQLRAYEEVKKLLSLHGAKLKDVWFVIARPELTAHNAAVRNILDNFDIEYAIDY